jgi:hypothetical protein
MSTGVVVVVTTMMVVVPAMVVVVSPVNSVVFVVMVSEMLTPSHNFAFE